MRNETWTVDHTCAEGRRPEPTRYDRLCCGLDLPGMGDGECADESTLRRFAVGSQPGRLPDEGDPHHVTRVTAEQVKPCHPHRAAALTWVNRRQREACSPDTAVASEYQRKELRMLGVYTFWDAIWTMIIFFAWVMFITWVILLMVDNFRRTDHSGWAKAGWALFIIFAPILGALVYTIARPAAANEYALESGYGYASASPTSTAEELSRLNDLRTQGAISDAEFEDLKARTIAVS
jgi:hypothetical protein